MLRIEIENDEAGFHLLRLFGVLDGLTYLDFQKVMNQSIENDAKHIVLDMNAVNYVSSAGLRVFLQGAKSLKKRKGEIVLFGMNATVNEVFKLSGFEKIFRTFSDEEEAVASI